jgi:glyoxylase-like metal-dependent hydrolase (beta-lactamase superfamily II)
MPRFICITCGTQYPESTYPPSACPICEDERQYVPAGGQDWTTMEALAEGHEIGWTEEAAGLFSLKIRPSFAIAQRAFLILHPNGNILWDCVSLIDAATVRRIEGLGGIAHIAISHPHYYSCLTEWSAAFGGVPVHIHEDDAEWVQRDDGAVRLWSGERLQLGAATMIRCGGHFAGASVLHCPWLGDGRGALFSGDTIQVVPDRRHVSFMYSYPNLIPLGVAEIGRIMDAVRPLPFDAIYGAFEGRTIARDGKAAVERSAERYLRAIGR